MRDLNPRLVNLLKTMQEVYGYLDAERVQRELDRIEEKIAGMDCSHLIGVYDETYSRTENFPAYTRHRVEEEVIRKLGSMQGTNLSLDQEEGLLHLLEKLFAYAKEAERTPEAPPVLLLTLMAAVHRILAAVEEK